MDVKAHPKNFCGALGLYGLEGTGLEGTGLEGTGR